uniref:BTB domain-containing protein n=1 Tax=Panagrolaimus sp. JU765 TaxID=591449 RepID=A0AC34R5F1_9BILA
MISLKLRIAANFPIKCNFSVRVGTQLLYHINKLFNNDCREYGFDNIGMEDDLFQDDVFETKWCVCLMPELDVVVKKAYRPPTLQLLDDEEFSDVILECKNGQVRAHKMILAAASPVFKGMFLSRENGNVVIDSFDVEVVKRAKLLMYTKEV